MSIDDRNALQMMENSVILTQDNHYQIRLPWRNSDLTLPNNRELAEKRLRYLKRRLNNDPVLSEKYKDGMSEYLTKGYAEKVPSDEITSTKKRWYLPHHPVVNPHKPDKVRIVFDCAAQFHGISLNSQLLSGPDLTNSIIGVLTRFRTEAVAIMGDIEGMFNQVRMDPEDVDCLRFLWWEDGDINLEPIEYRMLVHLFGATSSPSCSNFALRKTAADNESLFSEPVILSVRRNFYVDDFFKVIGKCIVCDIYD